MSSFNPHPLRRAGATVSFDSVRPDTKGFNPHPLRRAGATCFERHSLSVWPVSILTRSEERVQPKEAFSDYR